MHKKLLRNAAWMSEPCVQTRKLIEFLSWKCLSVRNPLNLRSELQYVSTPFCGFPGIQKKLHRI